MPNIPYPKLVYFNPMIKTDILNKQSITIKNVLIKFAEG